MESFVELDRVLVSAVNRRKNHVAVVFPRVPLHARTADQDLHSPVIEVELRVWNSVIEQEPQRLPRKLEALEVSVRGKLLRSHFPLNYAASGDVRLMITFGQDEPLIITGSRVSLRVLKSTSQLVRTRRQEPRRQAPTWRRR
jgi:hypothetical protein